MNKFIAIAAMTIAISFVSTSLFAQSQMRNCAPRDSVVPRLAETYGEVRQSIALGANNQVVEVFANEETGTWTITVTLPNGMSCLVASGQAYEKVNEQLHEQGENL